MAQAQSCAPYKTFVKVLVNKGHKMVWAGSAPDGSANIEIWQDKKDEWFLLHRDPNGPGGEGEGGIGCVVFVGRDGVQFTWNKGPKA